MSIVYEHVSFAYPFKRNQWLPTLQDVSFTVETGEFICLVGPSGCGKSTLLKLTSGLLKAGEGKIRFTIPTTPDRPQVAMVFQQYGVFPWLNVLDNITFGLQRHALTATAKQARAQEYLERVHLSGFEHAFPDQLSGGMQQRVNLARAFAADAAVLLMDEPFGSLDAQTKLTLQAELLHIWEAERKTVVFITHDVDEALLLSDRILVFSPRPAMVKSEIIVPLPRPRHFRDLDDAAIRELRWRIWDQLEVLKHV
ncbi:MAG: ABC transporter ATP-binding protein [Chloroflexota bacterium]